VIKLNYYSFQEQSMQVWFPSRPWVLCSIRKTLSLYWWHLLLFCSFIILIIPKKNPILWVVCANLWMSGCAQRDQNDGYQFPKKLNPPQNSKTENLDFCT